ncbi:putative uncharacterized protein [Bacteroides sp. CAG:530]|nr:putative uncharacterized protein [Bacteroides sp. CAG:530]
MNKRFLISIFTLSLMIIGLASCVNDNVTGGKPLPKGTEFDFGTTVDANLSRTYYDPTDVANPKATYWKIFWNYQDPLDQVYIYSPQAMTGRQQAAYTVHGVKDQHSATATKNSEIGIQLSDANTYDFYGMYPAQNVKANSGSGHSLSATMPIFQTASTTEIMNSETNVGNLETTADMNSALMIAKVSGFIPSTQNNAKVNLQFEPFATTLNVTVNGIEQSNFNYKVLITSIIIEADAPIAGDFTYNYETEAITFGENASNFIRIDTRFKDAAGHQIGVPMGPDSKLNVRAFMIPNPNVKSLKVKVVTSAAQTLTKTLNMTNFKKSQIHFAKLPKINASNLQFDYKIWLSQLDPNIYLSEISMPGSALTFSYKLSKDYQKTQTLDLTKQFENGIRVFQFHVNTVNQTSTYDGGSTSVGIALPDGTPMEKDGGGYWTIEDAINALNSEMKGLHKDEFCVVAISDWIAKPVTTAKMTTLYNRLKAVLNKAGEKGLVATNVSPNTTIADVKGKVIFKVQLNGSYTDAWPQLAGADVWMNIFKNDANTNVFYSPMPFGELPATDAGGLNASNLTGTMNFIYSEVAAPVQSIGGFSYKDGVKDCVTNVLAAYANNYSSSEHRNFSMTYLGGQGAKNFIGTKYYLPSQIAQDLNTIWLNYIRANTQNTTDDLRTKPWGWVMLNCVGTEPTTSWCIEAVIRHNADPVFKLQRRSEKARHSGDTQGTTNGGSIF